MKKISNITLLLILATLLPLVSGCSNDEFDNGKVNTAIWGFDVYVEFTHNGVNVADSLKFYNPETDAPMLLKYINDNDENIQIRFVRGSDNKEMDIYIKWWDYFPNGNPLVKYCRAANKDTKVVLRIKGSDMDIQHSNYEFIKKEYEETYTYYIKSKKIFNDDKEHTIRITTLLYGKKCLFTPIKLEQDGKEIDMEYVDILYNDPGNHCGFDAYLRWDV